jgi:hypothetical protein
MPNLTIKSLNYPQKASYNKDYEMSFTLNSDSEAKNVLVKLGNNQVFNLDLFKGVNDFNINFKGKSFYNKKLNLEINYKDMNNKTYSLSQPIEIQVENIPFYIEYDWLVIIILIIIILALILSKTLRNKLSH